MITNALAQTFFVSEKTGYFLTKMNLFVNKKSSSVPLKVEIREVDNGYPTARVLKYAQIVKGASSISASSTTPVATEFKFDTPIYLNGESEYAIVISSDSNDYEMWVARMGLPDVVTNATISRQPEMGSIFYSQNGSTWEPRNTDDLMFELYRAKFDTTKSGQFVATNMDIGWAPIRSNPFRTYKGSSAVRVTSRAHGLREDDYVMFRDATLNQLIGVVITNGGAGYTTAPNVTFSGGGGTGVAGYSVISDGKVVGIVLTNAGTNYTSAPTVTIAAPTSGTTATAIANMSVLIPEITSEDINLKPLKIIGHSISDFIIDLGKTINSSVDFGGTSVSILRNVRCTSILPKARTFVPENTQLTSTFTIANESGDLFDKEQVIRLNEQFDFNTQKIILSDLNESKLLSGEESLQLNGVLTTSSEYLSPVIDLSSFAATLTANRIDGMNHTRINAPSIDILTIFDAASSSFVSNGLVVSDHEDLISLVVGKTFKIEGCSNYVTGVNVTNPGSYAGATTVTFADPPYPAWNVGTAYTEGDVVKNLQGTVRVYRAVADVTGGAEPVHTSGTTGSWICIDTMNNLKATGTVTLSGGGTGYVTGVTITSPGVGYTTAPTVTFGTGTTTATGTATISTNNGEYLIEKIIEETPTAGNNTIQFVKHDTFEPVSFSTTTEPAIKTLKLYDRYISFNAPKNTSNQANYITQVINLSNQSTGANVYFDLSCPPAADLLVFYRTANRGGLDNIHDLTWKIMQPSSPIQKTKNRTLFTEIEYTLDNLSNFDQLQVKLVFKTVDLAQTPKVKNFRMIALA